MVSQEPAKLSTVLSGVWVRVPVPPPQVGTGWEERPSPHRFNGDAVDMVRPAPVDYF